MSPPGAQPTRPVMLRPAEPRCQRIDHVLGELAVGRELAAVESTGSAGLADPRRARSRALLVLDPLDPPAAAQAGNVHTTCCARVSGEILVAIAMRCRSRGRRSRRREVARVVHLGRADQRVVALERDREDDAPVRALEDVGVFVLEELGTTMWLAFTWRGWARAARCASSGTDRPRVPCVDTARAATWSRASACASVANSDQRPRSRRAQACAVSHRRTMLARVIAVIRPAGHRPQASE